MREPRCRRLQSCRDSAQIEIQTQCEGDNLQGQDCVDLGFPGGGDLACTPDTSVFDTSSCVDRTCGDGVVDSNEVCDCGAAGSPCTDAELDGNECTDLNVPDPDVNGTYSRGNLRYSSPGNCLSFDLSACHYCGDGNTNAREDCDGPGELSDSRACGCFGGQPRVATCSGCRWQWSGWGVCSFECPAATPVCCEPNACVTPGQECP